MAITKFGVPTLPASILASIFTRADLLKGVRWGVDAKMLKRATKKDHPLVLLVANIGVGHFVSYDKEEGLVRVAIWELHGNREIEVMREGVRPLVGSEGSQVVAYSADLARWREKPSSFQFPTRKSMKMKRGTPVAIKQVPEKFAGTVLGKSEKDSKLLVVRTEYTSKELEVPESELIPFTGKWPSDQEFVRGTLVLDVDDRLGTIVALAHSTADGQTCEAYSVRFTPNPSEDEIIEGFLLSVPFPGQEVRTQFQHIPLLGYFRTKAGVYQKVGNTAAILLPYPEVTQRISHLRVTSDNKTRFGKTDCVEFVTSIAVPGIRRVDESLESRQDSAEKQVA